MNLFVSVCRRNIKRIVFYSLKKLSSLDDGGVKVDLIDPSQALQIAGRAGNKCYSLLPAFRKLGEGYVFTGRVPTFTGKPGKVTISKN